MKTSILCMVPLLLAAADQSAVERLFDSKLNATQRANACFQLRGNGDPEVVTALGRALDDADIRACAADNLRIAGAVEQLKLALANPEPQVRAAAARELGEFRKPELLEPLGIAAGDENALVSTNALAAIAMYPGNEAIPYLTAIAKRGGMTGDMALDRLSELDAAMGLTVARGLLGSPEVPDKLYAMKIIGVAGDSSDLPELRKIAASNVETLAQRDRGFGLMPPINLARSAQAAIAAIEKRER
ncbi:MAG: HEAT repeat domain-containing protein [Bryobacteraceae bacterium]|jgi:HEAT repeats